MLDISNEGAKVLHNRCVEIGKKFNIPIIAKSTFKEDEGTVVNNKIESQTIKSLVKNDNLITLKIKSDCINYMSTYNLFIKNEIMPIEFIHESTGIRGLFNSDYEILIYNISRISIIGYGISNDTQIIKQITNILTTVNHHDIQKIDINNGKIRITFKTTVSNSILEKLGMVLKI